MITFNVNRAREYRATTIFGDAFRRPQRYGKLIQFEKLQTLKPLTTMDGIAFFLERVCSKQYKHWVNISFLQELIECIT